MASASMMAVGRVSRLHGVKGKVLAAAYGESLAALPAGTRLGVEGGDSAGTVMVVTLTRSQPHGRGVVLELEGILDPDSARRLVGAELLVERAALVPLGAGEYYCADLRGLAVRDVTGRSVGVLEEVFSNGEQDLFQVRGEDGRAHIVPAVREIVRAVDVGGGFVVIDPPEGLLEE